MSLFNVKVNSTEEFQISKESVKKLDVISTEPNSFHILKNNETYKAEITQANFNEKTYTVTINNNTYTVNIQDSLDVLIKDMGFEIGAGKKINELKAPMPGLILEINVAIGSEVKEDDPLLILEAMKMENVLIAPRDGVIKSISVAKGDTVDKNELLIAFE
tara:strand:- start:839660 stop:840142 length:483 start_codon:yes stop_codon:yes gene_type:complete